MMGYDKPVEREWEFTVCGRKLLKRDWVVLGRVEANRRLGIKVLGFGGRHGVLYFSSFSCSFFFCCAVVRLSDRELLAVVVA